MNDQPKKPIVPADTAAWIYFKHDDTDFGERPLDWWKHNQNFSSTPTRDGRMTLQFQLGNSGWANASIVQVDFYIPVGDSWKAMHDESLALESGEVALVNYKFTPAPTYFEDSAGLAQRPNIAIRATTLTSRAPSEAEILACLTLFNSDGAAAVAQLKAWKEEPGFFVYPCCALFPGLPHS